MAYIHLEGIYWFRDGCVIALPRRKNAQQSSGLVAFADTSKPDSLFRIFRRHCAVVAGYEMPTESRCVGVDRFTFRGIVKPKKASGHTWAHKRQDVMEMEAVTPITRSTYKKYLVRFRDALVSCCGLTRQAVKEFGMHSMRVGGETWLFENGMPTELRQRMGGWAPAFTEKQYIRTLVTERIDTCKGTGV
jgi:hypothetical protein